MSYTKEQIRELLQRSDQAVCKGVVALFYRQTEDERQSEGTRWQNGQGFSAFDAEILSSFAKQVIRWNETAETERKYASPLSVKQLQLARKKLLRYAGQLADIANQRGSEAQAEGGTQ